MPRPCKHRNISGQFSCDYFKPRGIGLHFLDEVELAPDELEALRLADYEGMYQADAAEKMKISRQTFGNIVESARKKVADALIHGKAIRIENTSRWKTPEKPLDKNEKGR